MIGATLYSYEEIKKATKNFKTKIGEGGCAKVYRGELDGQDVAVKCFESKMLDKSKDHFKNEVSTWNLDFTLIRQLPLGLHFLHKITINKGLI